MHDLYEVGPKTPEQEAELKVVLQFVELLQEVARREHDTCPYCTTPIDILQQVGRSVYARPCGCRLWQGYVPEAWCAVQDHEVTFPEWAEEKRRIASSKLSRLKRIFSLPRRLVDQ